MSLARRRSCWWLLGCVGAFAAPAHADELTERHSVDAQDLLAVERQHPAALTRFRQAEQLLAEQRFDAATKELELAKAEAPHSEVLARRLCQALTYAGRRSSAIAACTEASQLGQSPMTQRAIVGALMSGPPTPDEVAQTLRLVARAKKDLPSQPWGYAAECDLARRLGDRTMYKSCLDNLETVAPGHYETVRARRLGGFVETPPWVPLAWLGLFAAAAGTLAHASRRALARRSGAKAALAGLTLLLVSQGASAQETPAESAPTVDAPAKPKMLDDTVESMAAPGGLSKWKINDADPLKSVPTAEQRDSDPVNFGYHLMDLADKAQEAVQKGDYAQASKYWEATVLAVPDQAVGYRKTCITAQQAGDMNRAYRYCRAALGRQSVALEDYERFSSILMAKPTALQAEELADLQEISKHVREVAGGEPLADQLDCEYGLRTSELKKLDACAAKMAKGAPNDPRTITYQWAAALGHERFEEARGFIDAARKTDMKPEGIKAMEAATSAQAAPLKRLQKRASLLVAAAIGLFAFAALWFASRRRTKAPLPSPVPSA